MAYLLSYMLLVGILLQASTAIYTLSDDYSGDSFFDTWDFFTGADPTNGHVLYQSQTNAQAQGLINIQTGNGANDAGQIFIGVDSTAAAPNGRPSVRITTQKSYQHALVLADIAHQPGGICGVWPAFWMVGANWPQMGEIDIVEGVSTQSANQMTLHTDQGPILDGKLDFTGKLLTSNCNVDAPNQPANAGCGIADDSDLTFGTNFNAIEGGVYATEWTSQFIKIWFFPRNKIPADIQQGTPTPSDAWGVPNSFFQGDFSMDEHFRDLQIVMNTDFCGDWAGNTWSQTPECAALAPTCNEYVANTPTAFKEAFWLVNSVKVFQQDGNAVNSSISTGTSAPTNTPIPTNAPIRTSAPTPSMASSIVPSGPPEQLSSIRPHRPKTTITETVTVYTGATATPLPPQVSGPSTFVSLAALVQESSGEIVELPISATPSSPINAYGARKRHGGAALPMQVRQQ